MYHGGLHFRTVPFPLADLMNYVSSYRRIGFVRSNQAVDTSKQCTGWKLKESCMTRLHI